ncbi:uncharacterized protein K444DRAFT_660993 [Hyaloscypha bicolor E]|uniref:Yeast cell wall synthesis Kre9/Knh1-like N-terminal domain-containing protein n=1 Tax=Hyaloscypha bicolor E TaxID=1095630 RepID=A0A2J6TKL2_9HELO|nr:uncharacterized protein K444DRAFT_660993 [Hyaloscypha bicolor E]PMD63532.1 hypothetical protein K444DRAFT_660993 [Hyaloscypha bicolor E]
MLCFNVALLYFFLLFKPATAVQITNTNYDGIQTGRPFTVTWTGASGSVTMLLRMGNSTDLSKLNAMAIWVDLTGPSFVWTPGPILPTGPYRIELADTAVEPVYSPQFQLTNVPVTTTSSSTIASQTSASISRSSDSTLTPSTPSTEIQTSTATSSSTAADSSAAQMGTPTRHQQKTAIKVGVAIAFLFLIGLTTYFAISLIRQRIARKKRLSQISTSTTPPHGDGVIPKDTDLEHGRGAEMSGALDNAGSVSAGVSSPTTTTIGSRRTSTRPTTGSDIEMADVMEVEGSQPEPEPVEIGSSGYGKEMSGQEKEKAVEMEANQRIRFEERKRRRRGVRLMVGRTKVLF